VGGVRLLSGYWQVNGPPPPFMHVPVAQTPPAQHGSPVSPHAPHVFVPRSQTFGALQKSPAQQRSPEPPHGEHVLVPPAQRVKGAVQSIPFPQHC
jgi:hypothetical protein